MANDATSQLLILKDLTRRFSVLHEFQALQLKLWPHIVDSDLTDTTAEVDIENKAVHWIWTAKNSKETDAKRLKGLLESLQFMLGEQWTMVVTKNGEQIWPRRSQKTKRKSSPRRSSTP